MARPLSIEKKTNKQSKKSRLGLTVHFVRGYLQWHCLEELMRNEDAEAVEANINMKREKNNNVNSKDNNEKIN